MQKIKQKSDVYLEPIHGVWMYVFLPPLEIININSVFFGANWTWNYSEFIQQIKSY